MRLLSQSVKKVVFPLLEDLASPRALTVSILLKYEEWDQLATLQTDPDNYVSAFDYWRDVQATDFLRKYEPLPTSFDRPAVALATFWKTEHECLRSNTRLYPLLECDSSHPFPEAVSRVFRRTRKILSRILGPCPSIDSLDGRFGPGSTFGDRGGMSTIPDKMSSTPTMTVDSYGFLPNWYGTLWAKACIESSKVPEIVPGNRFSTVPKDCTKDRGIAMEPSINVFYQLSIGKIIRRRLSRWGIDLNEGQERHRQLACAASNRGHLSTLDLSNASDTICRNLVKILLPPGWFALLDSVRSKKTLIDGKTVLLEKFSSMGNGFTFELETLIFLSLAASLCDDGSIGTELFAYGDDLIVPSDRTKDVISLLEFCGFSINSRKSFSSGHFRESCGGDFFNGTDVRPFFLKKDPDEPHKLISLANGLRKSAGSHLGRWLCIRRSWMAVISEIPSPIRRCRGPSDLGDVVIHDLPDYWDTKWKHGIRRLRSWTPSEYRKVYLWGFSDSVALATSVYGVPVGKGYIVPRDGVTGYNFRWVPFSLLHPL
jgi:hypothetical protein